MALRPNLSTLNVECHKGTQLHLICLFLYLNNNITKVKINKENYSTEDGGNLWIPALQCFPDDMTCVIEETEKNLVAMKGIFEDFALLSGLEINFVRYPVVRCQPRGCGKIQSVPCTLLKIIVTHITSSCVFTALSAFNLF